MTDIAQLLEERQARYGTFRNHAIVSQELQYILRVHPTWAALSMSQREALTMICHKIARIMNGDPGYPDNWVDIAGYAKLVSDELEGGE